MQRFCWIVCVPILMMAATAVAQDAKTAAEKAAFEKQYRVAALSYLRTLTEHEGQVHACPAHDVRYTNSRGVDRRQWIKDNTEELAFNDPLRSWIGGQALVPPSAEADAHCATIPDFNVGSYGTIHNAKVTRQIEGKGFVLSSIKLVDEERVEKDLAKDKLAFDKWAMDIQAKARAENRKRWDADKPLVRGVGWDGYINKGKQAMKTRYSQRNDLVARQKKLDKLNILVLSPVNSATRPGRTWVGARQPFAIVDQIQDPDLPEQQLVVAIPVSNFRRGVTLNRFGELLSENKMTREAFVEAVEKHELTQTPAIEARTAILTQLKLFIPPEQTTTKETWQEKADRKADERDAARRAFDRARRAWERERRRED